MKLLSTLFAICSTLLPFPPPRNHSHNPNITLTFDDLPPALRLSPLPSTYNHLNFTQFSVFAPHSPFLKDYITPQDLNCAVSSPNALLGSRSVEKGSGASFEIANASAMVEGGWEPWFTLRSLQVKPMVAPAPGTKVWIKGYRHGGGEKNWGQDEELVMWDVDFPSGYHLPLLVEMANFSKLAWDRLYKVEIGADFGYDALDWEFCLDDLSVGFQQAAHREFERQTVKQNLLEADW